MSDIRSLQRRVFEGLALTLALGTASAPAQPMSGIYPVGSGGPGVDSFVSVQAAAAALNARGLSGDVQVPIALGTYPGAVILRRVTGSNNFRINLYSRQVGAVIDAGGARNAFLVESTDNVSLQGLRFQGARDTGSACVRFVDSDSGTVMRCRFGDSAQTGLLVERAVNFLAESLRVENPMRGPDSRGLDLRDCYRAMIERCSLQAALGTGVSVTGGSDISLDMVAVMNAGAYGIRVENSPRLSLMRSVVRNATVSALRVVNAPGTYLANCLSVGGALESAYFESCDSLSVTSLMLVGSSGRAISVVRSPGCALMQLSVQSQSVRGLVLDRSPGCTIDSLQVVNLNNDTAIAVLLDSSGGCAFRFCNILSHCARAISLDRSPGVRIMHARYQGDAIDAGFAVNRSSGVYFRNCSLSCTGSNAALAVFDSSDQDTLLDLTILGSPRTGILVRDCAGLLIANCFIRGWTENGVSFDRVLSPQLFYNSIVSQAAAGVSGARFRQTAATRALDNLIWNRGLDSSTCYRVEGLFPFAAPGSDHNDLYASGVGGSIARLNDTLYPFLTDWQAHPSAPDSHSLTQDPRLVTTTDYHIAAGSPCRDAGIPVAGIAGDLDDDVRDPVTPDIGADEYRPGSVAEDRLPVSSLSAGVLGNPVRGRCRLSYILDKAEPVRLRLFDASGQTVLLLPWQQRAAGNHVTSLNVSSLSTGVYLLELRAGIRTETMKLVLE